jgi:transcriptional regulator with XRE-family HTH domain
MLDRTKREKIDRYLGAVISAARKSRGLSVSQAASLTDLTEIEYRVIESSPSIIALTMLSRVMTAFGAQYELADAANRVTAIVLGRGPEAPEPERLIPPFLSRNSRIDQPPAGH